MQSLWQRGICLAVSAGLIVGLVWLDQHRGGPASMLSRCNLLLSRAAQPAADVLLVGSSRSGTALDPVAMQQMLAHATGRPALTVERIALGHNPLRASHALLENYLETRGAPRIVVLELMLETERTIERLGERGLAVSPEEYIFRRDLNLLEFEQILELPAVAMPYSEDEGRLSLWRYRLRGLVLRAGALAYEYLRQPTSTWSVAACAREDWLREPEWPVDFAFSDGEFEANMPPAKLIAAMEAEMAQAASTRKLKPWQVENGSKPYPYDFDAEYRAGEMALLESMIESALNENAAVVLLPLPLYGYRPAARDLEALRERLAGKADVVDLYGRVRGDLNKFWYDDGHIEPFPAGILTTAILAQHLQSQHFARISAGRGDSVRDSPR
jgi:hypothetical protein